MRTDMALVELSRALRRLPGIRRAGLVWAVLRVPYRALLRGLSQWRGITRSIEGEAFRWRYPFSEFESDFEEPVHRLFARLLRPGMVVLDVGASFGLYSVLAGRRVNPGGRVFAFEPLDEVAAVLRDHVSLNGLQDSVEIVEKAVSDQAGNVELWEPSTKRAASISRAAAAGHHHELRHELRRHAVEATTIDDFCESRGIDPDVIKIDVEGAEARVLRGARRTLARRSARLIVEVHPWALREFGESVESVLEPLTDAGWTARRLYARGDAEDIGATVHYVLEPDGDAAR